MSPQSLSQGVVHEVPKDLEKVIRSDQKVCTLWESLTPLARNEWICWTISVKTSETRAEHIIRVKSDLLRGKRRPCCWYGCIHRTDKKISPSIQNIIINKRKMS